MILANIERILIINLGGVGDLMLSTAAIKSLRNTYPAARLDILLVERGEKVMESYRLIDAIHVFPGGLRKRFALLRRLRKERYSLVVNMRTIVSWSSAVKLWLLFLFVGGARWSGRNTDGKGFFFDIRVPERYRGDKLEYEYDLDTARRLGAEGAGTPMPLPLSKDDAAHVDRVFAENGLVTADFITGIHPGGQPSRQWPAENFAALIRRILDTDPGKIVLTGSPGEKELCRSIAEAAASDRVIDLSGQTTMHQLAVVIRRCKMYVSNDTGAMHFCVNSGTPGVFLFGGGMVIRYAPYKDPARYRVLQHLLPCSPCEKLVCREITCMKSITVDEVMTAFTELKGTLHA